LLLKTRANKKLLVARNFKLTQKRTKLEFKALDAVIKIRDEKTKVTTSNSNKCSEADKIVTQSMGVSKAILENVIFCHQEDANWPMQAKEIYIK